MTKLKGYLSRIDKKKLATSAAVFAVIFALVAIVHRTPALAQFLDASGTNGSAATDAAAQAVKAAPAQDEPVEGLLVDINTADAITLTLLPGIGGSKADAIIAHREAHGLFYRIEDIMDVKGIGQALFESMKDSITVGDVELPPEAPAPVQSDPVATTREFAAPSPPAKVVVSALSPESEYVELYNAGIGEADLGGWSVKKVSSTGKVSTLVSAARLQGKVIPPGKYLLLARDGHTSTALPDALWPSSYTLAAKNNGLQLYHEKELVDAVAWTEIPEGKSYIRTSPDSPLFTIADHVPRNSLY